MAKKIPPPTLPMANSNLPSSANDTHTTIMPADSDRRLVRRVHCAPCTTWLLTSKIMRRFVDQSSQPKGNRLPPTDVKAGEENTATPIANTAIGIKFMPTLTRIPTEEYTMTYPANVRKAKRFGITSPVLTPSPSTGCSQASQDAYPPLSVRAFSL